MKYNFFQLKITYNSLASKEDNMKKYCTLSLMIALINSNNKKYIRKWIKKIITTVFNRFESLILLILLNDNIRPLIQIILEKN